MGITIIKQKIGLVELKKMAKERFGVMVKAVVDIQRGAMAVGGELHADEEAELLSHGSKQADLWGINIYVDQSRDEWIEFDSMINLRPSQGNRSREVEDDLIQKQITQIVNRLIE